MSIKDLKHVVRHTSWGGLVLVLDTGAIIGPEAEAMLQALDSRSVAGVLENLKIIEERGPEKFMQTYYVGYGDKSIGDCGSCTIFIEGVSMLVAKAIQDWELYNGQESSTRYIDFATQKFFNPMFSEDGENILENLRGFYLKGLEEMIAHIANINPRLEGEDEKAYEKAVRARAFDIMRGFLPAGASTYLTWHSTLRQVADKLLLLRHHPLAEVRTVADAIEDAVLEAFPSSFSMKRYEATEAYNSEFMREEYYFTKYDHPGFQVYYDGINFQLLREYQRVLESRPQKTELPKYLKECGMLGFEFLLDFGSFRDVERHRAVIQRMPLVTTSHGFHEWYLSQLTPGLQIEAENLLREHRQAVYCLTTSSENKQYYIPMGYQIPNRLTGTIPGLVWLVELRSTTFVHPTLRMRAQQMAKELERRYGPLGLKLHYDDSEDRFNRGRGKHDIVKKSES